MSHRALRLASPFPPPSPDAVTVETRRSLHVSTRWWVGVWSRFRLQTAELNYKWIHSFQKDFTQICCRASINELVCFNKDDISQGFFSLRGMNYTFCFDTRVTWTPARSFLPVPLTFAETNSLGLASVRPVSTSQWVRATGRLPVEGSDGDRGTMHIVSMDANSSAGFIRAVLQLCQLNNLLI